MDLFIDSHAHLNFPSYSSDLDAVLQRAFSSNVTRFIVPAINLETSHQVVSLSDQYQSIFAAIGIHPNESQNYSPEYIKKLKELSENSKIVAIGEIGLDFYHTYSSYEKQHTVLEAQLDLADNLGLPVLIHSRNSLKDILPILVNWQKHLIFKNRPQAKHPGVFHAFEGDIDSANLAIEHGYLIGIGGQITYRNSINKQELILHLPLENIILETDSPFLSPHPIRGKRNEPANIAIIAEFISQIKDIPINIIAQITSSNVMNLFRGVNPIE